MRFLAIFAIAVLGLAACKQSANTPAPAPTTTPAASTAERDALITQVKALDAEADRVTRELVKVKVERDQLKRELNELTKRPGCAPAAAR